MAEVLRIGSIVIFFYSADLQERMHVHVRQHRNEVKYWIDPEEVIVQKWNEEMQKS